MLCSFCELCDRHIDLLGLFFNGIVDLTGEERIFPGISFDKRTTDVLIALGLS